MTPLMVSHQLMNEVTVCRSDMQLRHDLESLGVKFVLVQQQRFRCSWVDPLRAYGHCSASLTEDRTTVVSTGTVFPGAGLCAQTCQFESSTWSRLSPAASV